MASDIPLAWLVVCLCLIVRAHAAAQGQILADHSLLRGARRDLQESVQSHNALNMCRKMQLKHHVVLGSSWGTLPQEMQQLWGTLNCKDLLHANVGSGSTATATATAGTDSNLSAALAAVEAHDHPALATAASVRGEHVTDDYVKDTPVHSDSAVGSTDAAAMGALKKAKKEKRRDILRKIDAAEVTIGKASYQQAPPPPPPPPTVVRATAAAVNIDETALPKINPEDAKWCAESKVKFGVVPQKSWGSLPPDYIDLWKSRRCDVSFTVARMKKNPVTKCADMDTNYTNADKLPLISVLAASTSRKIAKPSTKKMALFTYLLPSLIRTVDCGFRYEYVLGYDAGDLFYDTAEGMATVDKWFQENVVKPMGRNGVLILPLRKVRVNNTLRKPGPVFLEMARAAYDGGADFMYRINDDTEMVDRWPLIFVKALKSIPDQVGVVGPTCTQGNVAILTHDFVARGHMEIMQMNYYPPQLVDWWMDDWISFVYGKKRTFKATQVHVVHHVGAHGQRYEVDKNNHLGLNKLLAQGRQHIHNYLLKKGEADAVIKAFDSDRALTFSHDDVPK